ncbi:hypothetical protein ACFYO1_18690 [Nocardia sp. NPDC006044]|uniref:hypothetical protein n=1 Tax=Nocardia sp. NPDC006044 TaxID=3364306 RepID=UPI003690F5E0
MNRRTLCTIALTVLVAGAGAACSDDKSSSAAPATSSSAAPGTPGDYCQQMIQLSLRTRELGSKSDINNLDYGQTADLFDQIKGDAPAEVAGDIDKISAGYRAISKGQATIASVGPEIAQATLHMTQVNMEKCGPPSTPR